MIQRIRELRRGGLRLCKIAAELGVSSSVVRGILRRYGLESPIPAIGRAIEISTADEPAAVIEIRAVTARERHYFGLGGGCRYMHGEPVEMRFCGQERVKGRPYCEVHTGRCIRMVRQ